MNTPSDLGSAGSALWEAITAEFEVEGLDAAEAELLAMACRARDIAAACEVEIAEAGPVARTAAGNAKANPAVTSWSTAVATQLRAFVALGIPLREEQQRDQSGQYRPRVVV